VHFVTGGPRQLVIAATVLVALVIPFVLKSFLLPNRRNRAKPKPKNAIQRATSFVPIAMCMRCPRRYPLVSHSFLSRQ
jgi:hypothetical protein